MWGWNPGPGSPRLPIRGPDQRRDRTLALIRQCPPNWCGVFVLTCCGITAYGGRRWGGSLCGCRGRLWLVAVRVRLLIATRSLLIWRGAPVTAWVKPEVTRSRGTICRIGAAMGTEEQIDWFACRIQGPRYAEMPAICDSDHFSNHQWLLSIVSQQRCTLSHRTNEHTISESTWQDSVYACKKVR